MCKCRFNFDWEASEDTHEARLHEGSVLFGRGTLAGTDRRAQREDAARREQQLLSDMRRARGDRTTAADIKADMARASRASHIDDDPVQPQPSCLPGKACLGTVTSTQLCSCHVQRISCCLAHNPIIIAACQTAVPAMHALKKMSIWCMWRRARHSHVSCAAACLPTLFQHRCQTLVLSALGVCQRQGAAPAGAEREALER